VFGKQKGLNDSQCIEVGKAFEHFASVVETQFDISIKDRPCTSGSGGLGAALCGVLGATLEPTLEYLEPLTSFKMHLAAADLVITGEGRFDASSMFGKVPFTVAQSTVRRCIIITGSYDLRALRWAEVNHKISLHCLPADVGSTDYFDALRMTASLVLRDTRLDASVVRPLRN
jgi:glycerate kinase